LRGIAKSILHDIVDDTDHGLPCGLVLALDALAQRILPGKQPFGRAATEDHVTARIAVVARIEWTTLEHGNLHCAEVVAGGEVVIQQHAFAAIATGCFGANPHRCGALVQRHILDQPD
jgi:hypothetical protein